MGKIIALIIVIAAGWYVYTNVDFNKVKENSIETLKKEKTINAINSRRDREQADIDSIINGQTK